MFKTTKPRDAAWLARVCRFSPFDSCEKGARLPRCCARPCSRLVDCIWARASVASGYSRIRMLLRRDGDFHPRKTRAGFVFFPICKHTRVYTVHSRLFCVASSRMPMPKGEYSTHRHSSCPPCLLESTQKPAKGSNRPGKSVRTKNKNRKSRG